MGHDHVGHDCTGHSYMGPELRVPSHLLERCNLIVFWYAHGPTISVISLPLFSSSSACSFVGISLPLFFSYQSIIIVTSPPYFCFDCHPPILVIGQNLLVRQGRCRCGR